MSKLAAVAAILTLPTLLVADINRFNPSRDLERPDAVIRRMQGQESGQTALSVRLSVWEGVCKPIDAGRRPSQMPCPPSVPPYLTRCQPQPDCSIHANAPVLWPHAPRVDEQKTAAKEPRTEQAQVPNNQPVN